MPITVTCTCGKQFLTKDENAGRRARCPQCGNELIIPTQGGMRDFEDNPYLAPAKDPGPALVQGGPPQTSGKAIASLVLGITSFFCAIFTGIPAIILGVLGLRDIERSRGSRIGKGMATAGIVLGALSCVMLPMLGILVGLLLPAVQAAREAGRRTMCANNLRQIGLAMHNYLDTYGAFPPATTLDPDGKPLLSWRVLLLPYLDQGPLYQQFKLDEPWDSPANKPLVERLPNVYRCPSLPIDFSGTTVYQVLIGPGTLFEGPGVGVADVTDGTVNTLMVVESTVSTPWTEPSGLTYMPKTPIEGLGSIHPGGFNALVADGSVRFLKNSIAPTKLDALVTRNGGEVVSFDPD